ncbi:carboxymuconolactone decarboxylase family protein [Actinomycetota bacterium]
MQDDRTDLNEERNARIDAAMARLRAHDAEWADLFRTYVLDGMYERTVLDQKTRELCAVAALTVLDRPAPLRDHMKGALRNGATSAEVLEVVLQASVYGGFPVTLSAIGHLEAVLEELS